MFDKIFKMAVDKLYSAKETEKKGIKDNLKTMYNKLSKKDQNDYKEEFEIISCL